MSHRILFYHDVLFYLVFLSQILLISFYLPRKMLNRISYIFATYPPSDYPNLYPEPIENYEKARRNFRNMNVFILVVGLMLLMLSLVYLRSGEWDETYVGLYFMVQFLPMMLMEKWSCNYYRRMRQNDLRTTRKADLQPRRLFDFVSPVMIGIAIFVYLAFIGLILYIEQFDFPWFGGYWNIVGVTVCNLFFAGIIAWNIYGKKRDPYQAHEDRVNQIGLVVKQMIFMSIVATVYVSIEIILASLNLRHLEPTATSLYLQIIAVIGLRTLRVENMNFEVYKKEPLATQDLAHS